MKKFLAILLISFAFVAIANAQSTTPKFGTTANKNNTMSIITNGYTAISDAAGNDTLSITPVNSFSYYKLTLTDSCYIKVASVSKCFLLDHLYIFATGSSGNKVKFVSTYNLNAGTATLSTNGRALIEFLFDGAKFSELCRATH
jgi:hypothetical protein